MTSPFTGQVKTVGAAGVWAGAGLVETAGLPDGCVVAGADVPGLGEAWGETEGFTGWGVADWEGEGVTTTWMGPATAVLPPSPRFREEKR